MSKGFNVRHAFIISIGANKKCFDIINEIYLKREKEYYELYLNSGFYNDLLKSLFTIDEEDSINKLIGIVEYCYRENKFELLEKIIYKFNPSVVRFAKKSNKISLQIFDEKYIYPKSKEYGEFELFGIYSSLIMLGKIYSKNVELKENLKDFLFGTWDAIIESAYYKETRYKEMNVSKEAKEEIQKDIDNFFEEFGLDMQDNLENQKLGIVIGNLIDHRAENNTMKKYGYVDIKKFQEERSELFGDSIYKYIGAYSRILEVLGFNPNSILDNIDIDMKEIKMLVQNACCTKKGNNLSKEELNIFVVSTFYLYTLADVYNKSKYLYLSKSKEEKYFEVKKFEKELLEKERKIQDNIDKHKIELSKKENEIELLKQEIKRLKEENKQVKNKYKDLNSNFEDLNKEFININKNKIENQLNEIKENSNVSIEEAIEFLKDKKIVLFGGANNIGNIKTKLPNILLYAGEKDLSKDISTIKNADLIVLNSDFISHSFTKKLNSAISKYNAKYNYVGGTNIEKIILALYKYMQ